MLPSLARTGQVIAIEQQAHGRTADIDRPPTIEQMAEDRSPHSGSWASTVPTSPATAWEPASPAEIAIKHPDLVRKPAVASVTHDNEGFHPGLLAGMENLQPENLAGNPWQEEYARIAPRPED